MPGLIREVAPGALTTRLLGLGHTTWSTAMVAGSKLGGLLQTLVDERTGMHPSAPFAAGTALAAGGSN